MGSYNITELKLHLADSTFKQAVGIKENIVLQIKESPTLHDLVIVDMPEDPIAPIILGKSFLGSIKALINLYEGNVRIELTFVAHFTRKKKVKVFDGHHFEGKLVWNGYTTI